MTEPPSPDAPEWTHAQWVAAWHGAASSIVPPEEVPPIPARAAARALLRAAIPVSPAKLRSIAARFVPALARRQQDAMHDRLDAMAALGRQRGYEAHARQLHREILGVRPDLQAPRSFNEKQCVLKLREPTALHTQCSDKLAVRDYIADRVGARYLNGLIDVLEDPADLLPDRITAKLFAAKANHDCKSVKLCYDRETFDWKVARRHLKRALARDFSLVAAEKQYRDVPRKIMVEDYISLKRSREYRIFCFSGRPRLIFSPTSSATSASIGIYDERWRPVPMLTTAPWPSSPLPVPDTLDHMLDVARALSAPFEFARIDLYDTEGQLRAGEVTLVHQAAVYPFQPSHWDTTLGALLDIAEAPGDPERSLIPVNES